MAFMAQNTASEEHALSDWSFLSGNAQRKLPETTLEKLEDEGENMLKPILETEQTIFEGAKELVFSIEGLVSIGFLCLIFILCCGAWTCLCQNKHLRSVERRLARREQSDEEEEA